MNYIDCHCNIQFINISESIKTEKKWYVCILKVLQYSSTHEEIILFRIQYSPNSYIAFNPYKNILTKAT